MPRTSSLLSKQELFEKKKGCELAKEMQGALRIEDANITFTEGEIKYAHMRRMNLFRHAQSTLRHIVTKEAIAAGKVIRPHTPGTDKHAIPGKGENSPQMQPIMSKRVSLAFTSHICQRPSRLTLYLCDVIEGTMKPVENCSGKAEYSER